MAWFYKKGQALKDRRGHKVSVDDPVAFNLSGTIAHGRVAEIRWKTRYGKDVPEIRVAISHDIGDWKTAGDISKIGDPENLLVLVPGDGR